VINWPDSLVEEIASKRAILFLGSGISSSSTNVAGERPPSWKKLLEDAVAKFVTPGDAKYVGELLGKELFLDAAEVVFDGVAQADRRVFFQKIFAIPRFTASRFHAAIQAINAKIVITTNYDQLYEEQCGALVAGRGYAVRKYNDRNILNDVRSKDNLIVKAHGCMNNTEALILTRSDYFKIKKEHWQFYNVLDSLLTVNTVVFLGCSMTDPDIQLVLENTNIAATSDHTHYAILPEGRHPALLRAMENSYNIKALQYEYDAAGGHDVLYDSLVDLKTRIDDLRHVLV
jgi:hypothetical protein